jgi:hypothetical protein
MLIKEKHLVMPPAQLLFDDSDDDDNMDAATVVHVDADAPPGTFRY